MPAVASARGHKALPSPSGYVPCARSCAAQEHRGGDDPGLCGGEPSCSSWPSVSDLRGKQYLLIEYCCSPSSVLGTAAPHNAAVARLTEEFDATQPKNVQQVLELIQEAQCLGVPIALWASIPCTGGSQLQNINIARFGVTDKLRSHWKQFKSLWTVFQQLATAVQATNGLVAVEWPLRCAYWHDARVERFLVKHKLIKAVATACAFGMRPQRPHTPSEFIGKQWRISTNCAALARALDKRCQGGHQHVTVVGGETAATAFYPLQFATAVHTALAAWADRQERKDDTELKKHAAGGSASLALAATAAERGAFGHCPAQCSEPSRFYSCLV
mgnify:CR=1 FL=1